MFVVFVVVFVFGVCLLLVVYVLVCCLLLFHGLCFPYVVCSFLFCFVYMV